MECPMSIDPNTYVLIVSAAAMWALFFARL
nr:MAG TPA: hypothetical protein [Inoviridae sp.]